MQQSYTRVEITLIQVGNFDEIQKFERAEKRLVNPVFDCRYIQLHPIFRPESVPDRYCDQVFNSLTRKYDSTENAAITITIAYYRTIIVAGYRKNFQYVPF